MKDLRPKYLWVNLTRNERARDDISPKMNIFLKDSVRKYEQFTDNYRFVHIH